tara:strand:+ start:484 stop:699 length:216 start_codon:yes stop_codon:yes gene_type:complete
MAAHSERLINGAGIPLRTDDPLWKQECEYLTHQFYLVIINGPDFDRWGPYLLSDEEPRDRMTERLKGGQLP